MPARRDSTLISLRTFDGVTFHGYLLTKDKRQLERALSHMMHAADNDLHLHHLNIWLSTGPMVRDNEIEDIIHKHCPEAGKVVSNYKGGDKISFVAWLMKTDDPDNEKLMRIH